MLLSGAQDQGTLNWYLSGVAVEEERFLTARKREGKGGKGKEREGKGKERQEELVHELNPMR
jgi:hypothetical protein